MGINTTNRLMTDGGNNPDAEELRKRLKNSGGYVVVPPAVKNDTGATPQPTNPYLQYLDTQKAQGDQRVNDAADSMLNMYRQQATKLPGIYEGAKSGAYATARVQALGNNEALAAQGLAGNPYEAPTSGRSETARLYQDVALQNTLNTLSQEQRSAVQELQNLMADVEMSRQQNLGANLADYQKALAGYKMEEQEKQYKSIYDYLTAGGDVGTLTDEQKNVFNRGGVTVDQYQQLINQRTQAEAEQQLQTALEYGDTSINAATIKNANISDEAKERLLGQYQKIMGDSFTTALEHLLANAQTTDPEWAEYLTQVENAYQKGEISLEKRTEIYFEVAKGDINKVESRAEWNNVMSDLNALKEKLGSKYEEAMQLLREKESSIKEAEEEQAKANAQEIQKGEAIANVYSGNAVGGTDPIQNIVSYVQNQRKERESNFQYYKTPNGSDYTVFDKSNNKAVKDTSLSIGENVTVRINGEDTKAALRYYASKDKINRLGDMQVGEIKELDGYLYLKGNNKYFRLDVSDVKGIKDKF